MARKGKPRRNTGLPGQRLGIFRLLGALLKMLRECKACLAGASNRWGRIAFNGRHGLVLAVTLAVLSVLGLHLWHPPVPVKVYLEVTALRLTVASPSRLMNNWAFDKLNVSGVKKLEFHPLVTARPSYQGDGTRQAGVSFESEGSLLGLDLKAGAKLRIAAAANSLNVYPSPAVELHLSPNSISPVLLADHLSPDTSAVRQALPWPEPAKTLWVTMAENAYLGLILADSENLNLLDEQQALTVSEMAFEQMGYANSEISTNVKKGTISYDTKFEPKDLWSGQIFIIKPKQTMSIDQLELNSKRGDMCIHLRGVVERLEAGGENLLPSALERLRNNSFLLTLLAVATSVFTVCIAVLGLKKDSKPA